MKYGGIDFDLSYAPINRYQTRLPVVGMLPAVHGRILTSWTTTTCAIATTRRCGR